MKKLITLILGISLIYSCSTSSDENGNTTVAPAPPSNLTGTVASTTQINLSWTDNSTSESGFKIERKTGTNAYVVIGTTATDIATFNDSGLTPSGTYTYRVYSHNSAGNSPSQTNEVTLTTTALSTLPTLTTTAVSSITQTTASSGGNISNDGGAAITGRGVCWSTSVNPTIALSTKTTDGTGIGAFTSNITGLTANATYYVRAYATNSVGTAYGNEISFTTQAINYAAMYPTGTVFCNNVVTAVVDVTNPVTGRTWMDRNLGASQVATSSTDANANGDLYQWGRRADGHQCRNSGTINTRSSSDQPGHGNFILPPENINDMEWIDWRTTVNNNLWQGISGINNPCPVGYRIPTRNELNSEMLSWNSQNSQGAFNSSLRLIASGERDFQTGLILLNDSMSSVNIGFYWSSSDSPWPSWQSQRGVLSFYGASVSIYYGYKASGLSVRCIKN